MEYWRRRPHLLVLFVWSLVIVPLGSVSAHHGWSGYDAKQARTLTGAIVESGYEHPHGFVRLKEADKTLVIVLAPPSRMERRGLPRKALAPGTEVTVVAYPNRTDPSELRAERITVNGKTTELR
jgi:hypothetical protein